MKKHKSGAVFFGRPLFHIISTTYLTLIYAVPLLLIVWSFISLAGSPWRWAVLFFAPWSCIVLMIGVSGLCSLAHQHAIIAGTFPRDLNSRIYFHRRLYGTCWTAMYYCSPVYSLCLSVPPLKWMIFRIFGYRGTLQFTIYPDTWIRDLPLLRFGKGAYLSNRATIGTNIALLNGRILVDRVEVEDRACVGHLVMLAPGVTVGKGAEVGVGCAVGIRTHLGEMVRIGPTSALEHGLSIGADVHIGSMSFIGTGTKIAAHLRVAAGSLIPARQNIKTQRETEKYIPQGSSFSNSSRRLQLSFAGAAQTQDRREVS
jgi:acetyltransferase-like isoleucine patch superfamily enzyme